MAIQQASSLVAHARIVQAPGPTLAFQDNTGFASVSYDDSPQLYRLVIDANAAGNIGPTECAVLVTAEADQGAPLLFGASYCWIPSFDAPGTWELQVAVQTRVNGLEDTPADFCVKVFRKN